MIIGSNSSVTTLLKLNCNAGCHNKRKSEDIWHFGKILMEFGSISAGGMHNPFVKECCCSKLYGTESK